MKDSVGLPIQKTKSASEVLREQLTDSPLGLIQWDSDFRIFNWSKKAESIFGWSLDEVLGHHPFEWPFVFPEDRAIVEQVLNEVVGPARKATHNISHNRNLTKEGRVIYCEWYNSVQLDDHGQVQSILSLVQDVTHRVQAEVKLERAQHFMEVLVKASLDRFEILDRSGTPIDLKAPSPLQFDLPVNKLASGNWFEDWITESPDIPTQAFAKALAGETTVFWGRRKSAGKSKYWEVKLSPYVVEGEPQMRVLAVSRDVTDLRRSEFQARIGESKFRTLADSMPQMIWVSNQDGAILHVNRRWHEYTRSTEKCLYKHWAEYVHPNDLDAFLPQLEIAIKSWLPITCEVRIRRYDGNYRWHLFWMVPSENPEVMDWAWYGTCTDIHDRKIAQERAAQLQNQLQGVINSAPVILWAIDMNGRVTLSEGSGLKSLGLRPGEAVGRSVYDMIGGHPEIIEDLNQCFAGESFVKEGTLNGVSLQTYLGPLKNENGEITGVHGVSTDVTDVRRAEHELEKARSQFRVAQDLSPDGFLLLRPILETEDDSYDFVVDYANPVALSLFRKKSLEGESVCELLSAGENHPLYQSFDRVQRSGDSSEFEMLAPFSDRLSWFRFTVVRLEDSLAVHLSDITSRKQDQLQLEGSERKYRRLFDAGPMPKWIYDKDSLKIVDVNSAAIHEYGYSREQLLSMKVPDLVEDELHGLLAPLLKQAHSETVEIEPFMRIRNHNGSFSYVKVAATNFELNGESVHLVSTQNVTQVVENQKTLQLLAEAGQLMSQSLDEQVLLNSMGTLCVPALGDWWVVDLVEDGSVCSRKIVGPEGQEGLIRRIEVFKNRLDASSLVNEVIQSRSPRYLSNITDEYLQGRAQSAEHLSLLREVQAKSLICVPMMARDRVIGTMSFAKTNAFAFDTSASTVYTEIANRMALAIDNSRLYREAQRASEAKTAFLANVSHEIRTPLGAIVGFTDLLLEEDLSNRERLKYLNVVRRNGRQLSLLINDLLDLSKIEAGRLDIESQRISLSQLISEVTSLFSVEAAEKGIRFHYHFAKGAPDFVQTDPLRLTQILTNIVGNALKFTQTGDIHIEVRPSAVMKKGSDLPEQVEILVRDSGIGILESEQTRLFLPFSQVDSSMARRFGGTGLGLVLSRRLSEALGGTVQLIDSNPGTGSTFLISFDPSLETSALRAPRKESFEKVETVVTTDPHPASVILTGNGNPISTKKRILLVEDSPDNQVLISRLLKSTGAEVEFAVNGREGFEKAMQNGYDMVLMDIQMPVLDGYEAVRLLRANGFKRPVVALTAHAMQQEKDHAISLGFDGYLTKPVDRRLLLETINNSLSHMPAAL